MVSQTKVFKPSSKYLTKLYVDLLIICLFIAPLILLALIPGLGWVFVLIFIVVNLLWLIPTMLLLPPYVRSISYEVGEDELIAYQGFVTKSVKTIPYRTITDLQMRRGFIEREFFHLGSIAVQTAGQTAQGGPEIRLVGLENPEDIRSQLLTRIRAYRASTGVGTETEVVVGQEAALLKEILAEVKALRQDLAK